MPEENVYIALILNNESVSNFSSYNSVISLINSTYPNNKLIIEKYFVDGSITQTELSLDNFINKYPSGKRVSISTTTTILISCSNYFIKNNLDVLSISLSATSNLIKNIQNVLTYAPLNQYSCITNFMIYRDYKMEQIQVLYQPNTTNDVFLKDILQDMIYQSNLLNINISVTLLEQGKYDYSMNKSKTMILILGNTKDITNIYVTQQFLENIPKESVILLTDFNSNITDIFGNIPAIVQTPTNINFTTQSKSVYDVVKNNPDGFDYTIYPFFDVLFVLYDFTTNGLQITKENYISVNPYGSNPPSWLLNSYISPNKNSAPYGKYQYTFTKDVIIGNDKNLFLQYFDGGQDSLPDSYSICKIAGITPNNPSLIEYDDADYYKIYDSNDNLVCVRYNSNITNFIYNLNIGTTDTTRFIYKYNDDGYFTTLYRLVPFDMEIPKVNPTMSKQPIKLKYIISPQPSKNIVIISNNIIPENTQIGSLVGNLILVDMDMGENVKYELVSSDDSSDNIYFTMGSSLSNIYTNTTFNYRNKHEYSIRIKIIYNSGYSVENSISLFIVIPVANNINMSSLINTLKRITLHGTSVSGQDLTYTITKLPIYGTLVYISNGVYDYLPTSNNIDTIVYIVQENKMISLPGTVTIQNYSEQDVNNISKKQGSWVFPLITFDGNKWQFGSISSNDFFQFSDYNTLGNYKFLRN
jgi:hypothetical protein